LPGGAAENSLIADNTFNGQNASCHEISKALAGLSGTADLTPTNLGNNMTDDPNCTGYMLEPGLASTLGALQDNGGPVETIALLPGSPAIAAGGHVLGISTDARGIARPSGAISVGAYQYVLGDTTAAGGAAAAAPNTGTKHASTWPAIIVAILGLSAVAYIATHRKRSSK
jgi:hypothetical protein